MDKVFCSHCKKEIKSKSKYRMIMDFDANSGFGGTFSWGCYPCHIECIREKSKLIKSGKKYKLKDLFKVIYDPPYFKSFNKKVFFQEIAFFVVMILILDIVFILSTSSLFAVVIIYHIMLGVPIIVLIKSLFKYRSIKRILE